MQNDGKTTVSLGLLNALSEHFKRIGFIKPVDQRYLIEQGYKVDEDSILINQVCGIECNLNDMSPIAVERGFTEQYIRRPDRQRLTERIKKSFEEKTQKQKEIQSFLEDKKTSGIRCIRFKHSFG